MFGDAEQRQTLEPVAGGRHLAVDDREVPDNAGAVETLRKKIEEELTAHFDALDLSRTQIAGRRDHILQRSEEHTSELQSLMRISYAVFCLKKKTLHNKNTADQALTKINRLWYRTTL